MITSLLLVIGMMSGMVVSAAPVLTETTGTLTLEKYEPATSTDPEKTKPVTGAEFTAYQVVDMANGTYKVTGNFEDVAGLSGLLTNDEYAANEGGLTYTSTEEFEALIPDLLSKSETAVDSLADGQVYTSTENTTGVYTFGDMAIGIYLVVETKIPENYTAVSKAFLVSIPEWDQTNGVWNYDITAYPKNSPVIVDKDIIEGDQELDEATKSIGDVVDYAIETPLPYYGGADAVTSEQIAQIPYFVTDTMSKGLTFNNDVTATIEGETTPLVKDTDYTVTYSTNAEGETFVKIDFKWASLNDYQSKKILITYSATLNENAVVGPGGNTNKAELSYKNAPTDSGFVVPLPADETTVYTYGMHLTKTFNNEAPNGTSINASGVEFSLTTDGAKMWFATAEEGKYVVYQEANATEGGKVTLDGVEYVTTQKLNPTKLGALEVNGLNVGTYVLVEEESIEGFSKLASDVTIEVSEKKQNDLITGEVVAQVGDETLNVADSNIGQFVFAVNNVSKQFELPLTGGDGLLLYTIGGGVVLALAIIYFAVIRKKLAK